MNLMAKTHASTANGMTPEAQDACLDGGRLMLQCCGNPENAAVWLAHLLPEEGAAVPPQEEEGRSVCYLIPSKLSPTLRGFVEACFLSWNTRHIAPDAGPGGA